MQENKENVCHTLAVCLYLELKVLYVYSLSCGHSYLLYLIEVSHPQWIMQENKEDCVPHNRSLCLELKIFYIYNLSFVGILTFLI